MSTPTPRSIKIASALQEHSNPFVGAHMDRQLTPSPLPEHHRRVTDMACDVCSPRRSMKWCSISLLSTDSFGNLGSTWNPSKRLAFWQYWCCWTAPFFRYGFLGCEEGIQQRDSLSVEVHSATLPVNGPRGTYTGMHLLLEYRPRTFMYCFTPKELFREASIWSSLDHRHILKFLGIFFKESRLALVSQYQKNGSLFEFLLNNPDADRIQIVRNPYHFSFSISYRYIKLRSLSSGLKYLHSLPVPIMHGDIRVVSNWFIHKQANWSPLFWIDERCRGWPRRAIADGFWLFFICERVRTCNEFSVRSTTRNASTHGTGKDATRVLPHNTSVGYLVVCDAMHRGRLFIFDYFLSWTYLVSRSSQMNARLIILPMTEL